MKNKIWMNPRWSRYHDFRQNQSKTRENNSVEMMLVIKILMLTSLLSLARAYGSYKQTYKGFNKCGLDGWSCQNVDGKYEITYTCAINQPGARVWVWTARLPAGAEIFTVQRCPHLEVHMDCTKGSRTNILKEFRVYDVNHVEFLPPMLPGVFLHDNDQVPQIPPVLHIENADMVDFFPGIFDKQIISGCRYKFVELLSLEMINVNLNKIFKNLFHIPHADNFVMKNTHIKQIESKSINIQANATIFNTTFPDLPTQAITLEGQNISFVNNTFEKIANMGLKINSKSFTFVNNTVEEVGSMGLNVLGAGIDISHNVFEHLGTQALEVISPGYSPNSYILAFRYFYKFTHNFIKNINPGSLHFNWEVYSKLCVDVEFEHNLFECSCMNLGWVSISNGLGPKITKAKEFYDTYLYKEGNTCYGYEKCSLGAIIPLIQDVCNNKTNVSEICKAAQAEYTEKDFTTITLDSSTPPQITQNDSTEIVEKMVVDEGRPMEPSLSYMENKSMFGENETIISVVITLVVILALAAVCVMTVMWWFKKFKRSQVIRNSCTTLYKNEKDNDADSLVEIHEHHNELYDKE